MVKADKVRVVEEIKQVVDEADGFVLADYRGLTVAEITELRTKVREQGGSVKVFKNKLLKKAFDAKKVEGLEASLKENTLVVYAKEDFVAALKAMAEFAKGNGNLKVKGGYLSGKTFEKEQMLEISKLPGRKEMLAQVVGGIGSVVSGFVGVLNSVMTTFVGTIEAIEKKNDQ